MSDKPTTRHLDEILRSITSNAKLEEYLSSPGTESPFNSFIEYFKSLPAVASIVPADIYKLADLDRTYCYHIWNGTKTPSRDKILLLCIAAGLNRDETRRALEAGREAPLYPRSRRDSVISYAIQQKINVMETNALLDEMGMEILK